MTKTTDELIESYDRIAERYATEFFDELAQKPFEREVLDRFAAGVREGGSVLDIGCGPGQTVRYLKDRGLAIRGMDLSEGMLVTARERNPDVTFERHDFRCTGLADDSLAGIVGFYAIIHLLRNEAHHALEEFYRVLEPGGSLLLSFHGGEGQVHADEWFGEPVIINATFFRGEEMAGHARDVGFEIVEVEERDPYPSESPVRRVYQHARVPSSDSSRDDSISAPEASD